MRQKMLPVRCNKNSSIKHLLVYQEKKPKVVIVFFMLFHGNMKTAALRRADFTQFRQLHSKKRLSRQNSRDLLDLHSKP